MSKNGWSLHISDVSPNLRESLTRPHSGYRAVSSACFGRIAVLRAAARRMSSADRSGRSRLRSRMTQTSLFLTFDRRPRTTGHCRSEVLARRARATGRVGIAANQTALDGEPHRLANQRRTAGAAPWAQLSATVPDRRTVEGLPRSSWRGLAVPVRRTPVL